MDSLVEAIFIKNRYNFEVRFQLIDTLTSKDLAHFFHSLLIKGLILLYGQDNKLTLNLLRMDQINKAIEKLRLAHVKVHLNLYDKETAIDLSYMPASAPPNVPLEISVARFSHMEMRNTAPNLKLTDYVFKTFLDGKLVCVSFEVI